MIAIDEETHLLQKGLAAPPIVCVTWATEKDQGILLPHEGGLDFIEEALLGKEELAFANAPFDLTNAAVMRPHLLDLIFKAYDEGRIFDVLIAEPLLDVFKGMMFKDPLTMREFSRYSLGMLIERYLGRASRKLTLKHAGGSNTATPEDITEGVGEEDEWRLRYARLEGKPLSEWPEAALKYAIGDARDTWDVAWCQKQKKDNLDQQAEQARAGFALHLAAVWGIRTDPVRVPKLVAEVERKHQEMLSTFQTIGIYRPDGTKDTKFLANLVATAYGGFYCSTCGGNKELKIKARGRGKAKVPEHVIVCPACRGEGNNLEGVPLTEKGAVSTSRDTLMESGDETLQAFAETGENETLWKTFAPVLSQGTQLPINPETNVLVATGRASYRRPNLTNQPRHGGIRECYVPREG